MSLESVASTSDANNKRASSSLTEGMCAVSVSKLLELFHICYNCGSMVTITQSCLSCDGIWKWQSQEMIGTVYAGNIGLSMAILAAGAIPSKVIRVLQFWGIRSISSGTYFRHQSKYLNQAVRNVWEEETIQALAAVEDVAKLSGDGRCDSPGHCAKYGSYKLHDTGRNAIVFPSTEVKNSYHMELEGLSRCVDEVKAYVPHVKIELTTDGHKSVEKWLREEQSDTIKHYFDVWHVAKGLRKRLKPITMNRRFQLVNKWLKSIINHLYWCAMTRNNDQSLILAKWRSIVNHIAGVHTHEENELFPKCIHSRIPRQWFKKGTEEYDKVCALLLNKNLLHSISKLSSDGQTSGLEGYHSSLLHFAQKMYHFGDLYSSTTGSVAVT
ncbi:uncharacterized protein LOC135498761 isoform X1 [Lineus longissimus]|uniref:uncharacterized protein LOC135498761 isoform X1 n=2 Tax=Lineus longissimus TaxID=88925 RepID=UPI00315D3602